MFVISYQEKPLIGTSVTYDGHYVFFIFVTPVDQMSDKSGFDIWCECHLKPDGMILSIFRCMKN